MKKMNKLFVLLLLVSMVLMGCSKSGDTVVVVPDGEETDTDQAGTTEKPAEVDIWGKYEEPVEVELAVFLPGDIKFPEGDSFENNIWTRLYKEELNVDVKFKWVAQTWEVYEQKMNIDIAAGDLPDIFWVIPENMYKLNESGSLANLTEAYNAYLIDTYKDLLEVDDYLEKSSSADGKLIAMPEKPLQMDATTVWLREDYLDAVDADVPTSYEELLELARTISKKDVSGSGTFGLPLNNTLTLADGLFAAHGVNPRAWISDGEGGIVFGGIQEEAKQVLADLAALYAEGVIDPEFVIKGDGAVFGDLTAGKFGILAHKTWNPFWPLNQMVTDEHAVKWIPINMPSVGGGEAPGFINAKGNGRFVVNKEYEHPEVLMKMMNVAWKYLGVDSEDASIDYHSPDGIVQFKLSIFNYYTPIGTNGIIARGVAKALEQGSIEGSGLNELNQNYYIESKKYLGGEISGTTWANWAIYNSEGSAIQELALYESGNIKYDEMFWTPGEMYASKWSTLSKLQETTYTKIIMGEESIDAFDTFVEDWKALGGDDITLENNEIYKSYN
ncbi:extracellular solute-binding protein [Vallitalea pronyensis]|uniref:Extracellular solute-binding protein n=1 Tax=Vallitalea pronyensis TaxID=1348613 RepID=A0A8J8MGQ7_9FIRM|nr:extracellular solute-binding protein [Vallitalea pronyensis]QUI21018.1 extracellular solute-binding protein [Vallitalea pronyensis]